jgi:hypothetical protein
MLTKTRLMEYLNFTHTTLIQILIHYLLIFFFLYFFVFVYFLSFIQFMFPFILSSYRSIAHKLWFPTFYSFCSYNILSSNVLSGSDG